MKASLQEPNARSHPEKSENMYSMSLRLADCSWFHMCELAELQDGGDMHTWEVVR